MKFPPEVFNSSMFLPDSDLNDISDFPEISDFPHFLDLINLPNLHMSLSEWDVERERELPNVIPWVTK